MADTQPANKIKKEDVVVLKDNYFKVIERTHQKIGRQGGIVKMKLKNLQNGNTLNYTFNCDQTVEIAEYTTIKAQYLYADQENYFFMDPQTYEQYQYPISADLKLKNYLKEGLELDLNMSGNSLLSVNLPIKMALKVVECPPNEKGDTATGATKRATLETGLKINVPLFINVNDKIIVKTTEDQYVERAKQS